MVDDLRTGRSIMRQALEARGWDVRIAASLGEALALPPPPPRLVVADLNLPDSRGAATMHRLAAAFPAAELHVLSAASDEEDVVAAVQAAGRPFHDKSPPYDWLPRAEPMNDSMQATFGPHWPTKMIAMLGAAIAALGWAYVGLVKEQMADDVARLRAVVERQHEILARQQESLHGIRTDLAILTTRIGRADGR